ncbi:MAG TPA: SRPBCC family protein, partial [Verrucomicrobiae bacterium]|nr:SRPBCC family protein [Verrucomicrobiae bacterium]
RNVFPTAAARDFVVKEYGAIEGGKQTLERLSEHLPKMLSTSPPFVITRTFDAPRELVWKAWTERDRLLEWFGPKGFKRVTASLDFKPGGIFHYCLQSPDGKEMWGKFVYREIVPPQKIVLINSFSDAKGGVTRHPFSASWPLEMLTTTTLVEEHGKTKLTLEWVPLNPTAEERQAFDAARPSMSQGWTGTFEQLDEYLAKQKGKL